ncbi:hypothetical protein FHS34_008105 [Streptomyces echinatus]|uniref:Uncharacterized protein n=1 Tax=Streptomyces echinatus TaxID=67293 RepID=A0A7W9UVA6_9ACTN|nr:hypothetical protein [Streptomyces echinatus]
MDQHEHCACYERVLTLRQAFIDWVPVVAMAIDVLRSFWS